MAHLLVKLGKEALRPQRVNGIWHKAAISAKNAARLRKEALLEGKAWEFDEPPKESKFRKPKGHKHDRLKPQRDQLIASKLENMDKVIAEHRRKKREINASLIDTLLMSPKQLRLKQRSA